MCRNSGQRDDRLEERRGPLLRSRLFKRFLGPGGGQSNFSRWINAFKPPSHLSVLAFRNFIFVREKRNQIVARLWPFFLFLFLRFCRFFTTDVATFCCFLAKFTVKETKCLDGLGLHHIIQGVREHSKPELHATTNSQSRRVNQGCLPSQFSHYVYSGIRNDCSKNHVKLRFSIFV